MTRSQKVAVVTSRLRRLIAPDEPWLVGLRSVLRQISIGGKTLVIGDGTAGADFVLHGAARLGISYEVISPSPDSIHNDLDLPLRDQIVIAAADVVYVLNLRAGGNLHQLLRERLRQRRLQVILVDLPNLQAESARKELCELGAQTWGPTADQCVPLTCLEPRTSNQ